MKAAPTSNTMFGFIGDPLFQFLKSGWKPKQTRRSTTVFIREGMGNWFFNAGFKFPDRDLPAARRSKDVRGEGQSLFWHKI
jgi:hypothetical protein